MQPYSGMPIESNKKFWVHTKDDNTTRPLGEVDYSEQPIDASWIDLQPYLDKQGPVPLSMGVLSDAVRDCITDIISQTTELEIVKEGHLPKHKSNECDCGSKHIGFPQPGPWHSKWCQVFQDN